jgi:hypothetical protein
MLPGVIQGTPRPAEQSGFHVASSFEIKSGSLASLLSRIIHPTSSVKATFSSFPCDLTGP